MWRTAILVVLAVSCGGAVDVESTGTVAAEVQCETIPINASGLGVGCADSPAGQCYCPDGREACACSDARDDCEASWTQAPGDAVYLCCARC